MIRKPRRIKQHSTRDGWWVEVTHDAHKSCKWWVWVQETHDTGAIDACMLPSDGSEADARLAIERFFEPVDIGEVGKAGECVIMVPWFKARVTATLPPSKKHPNGITLAACSSELARELRHRGYETRRADERRI